MSLNQNIQTTLIQSSPGRTLNLSTDKPETRAKYQAQDLREVLKERMAELAALNSEWSITESSMNAQCEALTSQLRDLDLQFQNIKSNEQVKHIQQLKELQQQHKDNVLFLQNQINERLEGETEPENLDEIQEYDNEIAALKAEIARWEDQPLPTGDDDLIDEEADERIRKLEEQYEEMVQIHDEAIQQREDDSKDSMSKIEQIILKGQDEEEKLNQDIQELIDKLNNLDANHVNQIEEMQNEMADERAHCSNSLKNISAKINQIQIKIAKKQRECSKRAQELHTVADDLRSELDSYTTRQKQQIKEATAAAKAYAEVKRKFVSMHKELEMLNSEKVREIVEHETLMKGLNKMDNFVLSQMSASGSSTINAGSRGSSSRGVTRTSIFSSSHGSKF
ncbi:hypothetical protein M9Y10_002725 [Tritrichomonas musculus]|uniref:Uncharacterized protein n=1 Tax=Tritrichomonas musculus TaxID=1915356 RepID=A0ABR2LAP4_9EUKA